MNEYGKLFHRKVMGEMTEVSLENGTNNINNFQ